MLDALRLGGGGLESAVSSGVDSAVVLLLPGCMTAWGTAVGRVQIPNPQPGPSGPPGLSELPLDCNPWRPTSDLSVQHAASLFPRAVGAAGQMCGSIVQLVMTHIMCMMRCNEWRQLFMSTDVDAPDLYILVSVKLCMLVRLMG